MCIRSALHGAHRQLPPRPGTKAGLHPQLSYAKKVPLIFSQEWSLSALGIKRVLLKHPGPLGTRPDPWEEGTRGAPHQSWCQCHMCQPCLDFYAREWGGPLPPGTAGTGEEPSSSRAAVPGTASASPVHRLGTAIGDRPHDRAMRELGPDQREWWLTRSGWWWPQNSPDHDWYPWQGERWATWLPN